MADNLDIVVRTRDMASRGLGKIAKQLGALAAGFLAVNTAIRVVQGGLRLLMGQLGRALKLSIDYEKNAFKLATALGIQGETSKEATKDLLKFADALQRATQFTDDDIVPAMVQLANISGATGDELKELTQLTLDAAVVFERDLKDAAVLVGLTAVGVTRRINELGIRIDDSIVGPSARAKAGLAALRGQTDDFARAVGVTLSGRMLVLQSIWDSFLRTIGDGVKNTGILQEAIKSATDEVNRMIDVVGELVEDPSFHEWLVDMAIAAVDLGIAITRMAEPIAKLFRILAIGADVAAIMKNIANESAAGKAILEALPGPVGRFVAGLGDAEVASLQLAAGLLKAGAEGAEAIDKARGELVQLRANLEGLEPGAGFAEASAKAGDLGGDVFKLNDAYKSLGTTLDDMPFAMSIDQLLFLRRETQGILDAFAEFWDPDGSARAAQERAKALELEAEKYAGITFQLDAFLERAAETRKQSKDDTERFLEDLNEQTGFQDKINRRLELQNELLAIGTQGVAELGGNLVEAALLGEKAFGQFFKAFFIQMARAIAMALILKALTAGGGKFGGFVAEAFSRGNQGGQVARAQAGGIIAGARTNRDSVLAALTPGEVIVRAPIVEEIERRLGAGTGGGGTFNQTLVLQGGAAGGISREFVEEFLERQNELVEDFNFRVVASDLKEA